jgi:YD repeat-containing protein
VIEMMAAARVGNHNNVTQVSTTNGGAYTYTYDELNRLTKQTWVYGGQTYVTNYAYDANGCLITVQYPTGTTLALTCDTANRTTSISIGGVAVVSAIAYHPSGQVKAMTYSNGKVTNISFDDRARVKTLTAAGATPMTARTTCCRSTTRPWRARAAR